ncbi:hypothetical protein EJ02DRAFT_486575 [Clathrospora elynae]|uniref:Uncharacterized protein n=1 Tax=Clathrospora elynae TaxID=706981 RepID=A0A6A5S4W8_9PLEO|nr:hypothetical protein EJ02DRAFT_486575 [Clathrospora elynae]
MPEQTGSKKGLGSQPTETQPTTGARACRIHQKTYKERTSTTKHQLSKVSERSKFINFLTFSISNSLPDLSTALILCCSVVGRCADGFVAAGDLTNFQRSVHYWDQDVWSREQHN